MAVESPSVEKQQSGETNADAQAAQPRGFPVTIIETPEQANDSAKREEKTDQHEAADLNAQVRAANAAERSAATAERQEIPAWSQIIIGAAGTVIALVALVVSLATAILAIRTTKAQTRAYVYADAADLVWGDERGGKPLITIVAKNSGQTPARWFEAKFLIFIRQLNEDGTVREVAEFADLSLNGRPSRRWNALGSNSELSFPATIASDMEIMKNAYGRKDISLNIAGTLRYETFFGEIFESQFWFTRRAPPLYKRIETSRKEMPGLTVTEGYQEAIKFQRASCVLKSFVLIRKSRWWAKRGD